MRRSFVLKEPVTFVYGVTAQTNTSNVIVRVDMIRYSLPVFTTRFYAKVLFQRLDAVEDLMSRNALVSDARLLLRNLPDLERLLRK